MRKIDIHSFFKNSFVENENIFFLENKEPIYFPESGYDKCFGVEDNSFWFNHRNNCILSAFKKYASNKLLIDLGGGNGKVSKYLQDHEIDVILIEAGEQAIKNANLRGVKHLIHANLNDLQVRESSIPSIGMFDVLEHIHDDFTCIKNVYDWLQVGGIYCITVPAYQFLWSNEDIQAGHFRRYSMSNLLKKIESVGFKVLYSSYIFQYLPVPIFMMRSLPYLFNRPIHSRSESTINSHIASLRKCKWLNYFNTKELDNIKKGKKMNFGGSILVVAEK